MNWEQEEREERAKRQAEMDENVRRIRIVHKRLGTTVQHEPPPATMAQGCLTLVKLLVLIAAVYVVGAFMYAVFMALTH